MAKNQHTSKDFFLKFLSVHQKLGIILESQVVQKLILGKKNTKKWSPKLIISKKSVDFLPQKLTLKVQFWHFLMNCNSLTDLKNKQMF